MRPLLFLSLLAASCAGVASGQQTVVVTSSGMAGGQGQFADGAAWPTNGAMTFDVGVFPEGFDPTKSDRASWIGAWQSARQSAGAGAVTSWFRDGDSTYFSITGASAILRPADRPGAQYYVWGFNTRTTAGSSEWILLTNPAWRVVNSDTPRLPDVLDTQDAGTIALVGQIGNGGLDLKSERVFAAGLSLAGQVGNFAVVAGEPATLSVSARGAGLVFQWYAGAKGDTSAPITGATRPTYTVPSLTATARYWVRISNGIDSVDSDTITVTAAADASGVVAAYEGPNLGYVAGQRMRVTQQVSYTGTVSEVKVSALLPAGWAFLSSDGPAPQAKPQVGESDLLEWKWTTVPASPFLLSYVVSVPAGLTAEENITTLATVVRDGVARQAFVRPDPIVVRPAARLHTADTDRNNRIDLAELLRVIALYNTRSGGVRTGAYRVNAANLEDGFDQDSTRSAGATVALAAYHAADIAPRDGRISLGELTRVIELYNHRVGTSRVGAYFVRGDTEDGFVSGVAP